MILSVKRVANDCSQKFNQDLLLLALIENMTKLFQITIILSLVVFLGSLVGLGVKGENEDIFVYIYFCAPVLWILWIFCAIQGRKEKVGLLLLFLWIIIDLSILVNLISLSAPGVHQSIGVDMTMLIAYFPVILPIGFLFEVLPHWMPLEGVFDPKTVTGSSMIVWVDITKWAAAQSTLIYWVPRLLCILKNRR